MTTREPPRLALALLDWLVPDSGEMAGDLIEAYEQRPSPWWVWREVLAAIAFAWRNPAEDIRPLRLVDLQPAEAIERTRRFDRREKPVSPTASPLAGISGLTTAVLALLMTLVMPSAWWLFGASLLAGAALGLFMIARRRSRVG
jgi:hypothetical protein